MGGPMECFGQPVNCEELCHSLSAQGHEASTCMARTSRVSREAHVRMCAGLEVNSLRSTRHFTLVHCVLVFDLTMMCPLPTKGRSEGVRAALSFANTALSIPQTVGNLESASCVRRLAACFRRPSHTNLVAAHLSFDAPAFSDPHRW